MNVTSSPATETAEPDFIDPVAPSTRVPVIPANRALLRFLRAAELEAWEATSPRRPFAIAAARGRDFSPAHELAIALQLGSARRLPVATRR